MIMSSKVSSSFTRSLERLEHDAFNVIGVRCEDNETGNASSVVDPSCIVIASLDRRIMNYLIKCELIATIDSSSTATSIATNDRRRKEGSLKASRKVNNNISLAAGKDFSLVPSIASSGDLPLHCFPVETRLNLLSLIEKHCSRHLKQENEPASKGKGKKYFPILLYLLFYWSVFETLPKATFAKYVVKKLDFWLKIISLSKPGEGSIVRVIRAFHKMMWIIREVGDDVPQFPVISIMRMVKEWIFGSEKDGSSEKAKIMASIYSLHLIPLCHDFDNDESVNFIFEFIGSTCNSILASLLTRESELITNPTTIIKWMMHREKRCIVQSEDNCDYIREAKVQLLTKCISLFFETFFCSNGFNIDNWMIFKKLFLDSNHLFSSRKQQHDDDDDDDGDDFICKYLLVPLLERVLAPVLKFHPIGLRIFKDLINERTAAYLQVTVAKKHIENLKEDPRIRIFFLRSMTIMPHPIPVRAPLFRQFFRYFGDPVVSVGRAAADSLAEYIVAHERDNYFSRLIIFLSCEFSKTKELDDSKKEVDNNKANSKGKNNASSPFLKTWKHRETLGYLFEKLSAYQLNLLETSPSYYEMLKHIQASVISPLEKFIKHFANPTCTSNNQHRKEKTADYSNTRMLSPLDHCVIRIIFGMLKGGKLFQYPSLWQPFAPFLIAYRKSNFWFLRLLVLEGVNELLNSIFLVTASNHHQNINAMMIQSSDFWNGFVWNCLISELDDNNVYGDGKVGALAMVCRTQFQRILNSSLSSGVVASLKYSTNFESTINIASINNTLHASSFNQSYIPNNQFTPKASIHINNNNLKNNSNKIIIFEENEQELRSSSSSSLKSNAKNESSSSFTQTAPLPPDYDEFKRRSLNRIWNNLIITQSSSYKKAFPKPIFNLLVKALSRLDAFTYFNLFATTTDNGYDDEEREFVKANELIAVLMAFQDRMFDKRDQQMLFLSEEQALIVILDQLDVERRILNNINNNNNQNELALDLSNEDNESIEVDKNEDNDNSRFPDRETLLRELYSRLDMISSPAPIDNDGPLLDDLSTWKILDLLK